MWAHGAVPTDVNGQFRMTSVPPDARVWLQTWKDGHVHQCAAPQITVQGDTVMDLALVSRANLSSPRLPVSRRSNKFSTLHL
jgi:hypothetical protein